ncbi:hypothetical protein MTR_7g085130 [Medicago truncatula]|uniref:Uncharacterized protein n=1 Tax=Medicago truncatula TaxID=3880 RepID=G7KZC4_MEDTR|nr:hypothetical protein MTR_7g085130 [Medicago truncatula]
MSFSPLFSPSRRSENPYVLLLTTLITSRLKNPMCKSIFHIGQIPDVKWGGHTTSPLVTSGGIRFEKSNSTNVKCHFCSSDRKSVNLDLLEI